MNKKAFIFDLDGTLIDSLTDIALCANKVLKKFNLPTHKIDDYKKFVGGGAQVLIENCVPKNSSQQLVTETLEEFKTIYDRALQKNTKPYDGIYELLELLTKEKIQVGILSNKPHEFTIKYVEEFFSSYNITEVHGQKEDVPKKPNPHAAINIANAFNIACKDIHFVGDTDIDMQTAKNANMIAVGVDWGFRDRKELLANGADFIVNTPKDIFNLINT